MYVGVILSLITFIFFPPSVPHVCGGDPDVMKKQGYKLDVFPMYVGVILRISLKNIRRNSVPHVCGGDPIIVDCTINI